MKESCVTKSMQTRMVIISIFFSILGMERKEVQTHSVFIYELINPSGSHGQGDIFLQLFAKNVLGIDDVGSNPVVKREDPTSQGRRIDFTIITNTYALAIELKIDAKDQDKQLYDYHKEFKNKYSDSKTIKLFYLTLDGKSANSNSTNGLSSSEYYRVSFEVELLQWLYKCHNHVSMKYILREAVYQYIYLVELLIGKNLEMNNEISALIVSKKTLFSSALLVEKSVVESKILIQLKFEPRGSGLELSFSAQTFSNHNTHGGKM